jgi:hypothetical protein
VNTLFLQPKNSTEPQSILSDAVDFITLAFRSYINKYNNVNVPYVNCFDKVDPSFGEKFYRFIELTYNIPSIQYLHHAQKATECYCNETVFSSLFRHMIQQSFIGKTGYFAFDERGNTINAEYEV